MSLMEAEEELRVSAQIPSDKQLCPVILLGFTLRCNPPSHAHLCVRVGRGVGLVLPVFTVCVCSSP